VKFGVVDFYRVSDEQGSLFRKLLIDCRCVALPAVDRCMKCEALLAVAVHVL
jgi:hypothetical protein